MQAEEINLGAFKALQAREARAVWQVEMGK
jgi:hypothetical protein